MTKGMPHPHDDDPGVNPIVAKAKRRCSNALCLGHHAAHAGDCIGRSMTQS